VVRCTLHINPDKWVEEPCETAPAAMAGAAGLTPWPAAGDGTAGAGPSFLGASFLGVSLSLLSSAISCFEELAELVMLPLMGTNEVWAGAEKRAAAAASIAWSSNRESLLRDWGLSPKSSLPAGDGVAEPDSGGVCGSGFSRLCLRLSFLGTRGQVVGDDDLASGSDGWPVKLRCEGLRVSFRGGDLWWASRCTEGLWFSAR
jgi:hypothetical protein